MGIYGNLRLWMMPNQDSPFSKLWVAEYYTEFMGDNLPESNA